MVNMRSPHETLSSQALTLPLTETALSGTRVAGRPPVEPTGVYLLTCTDGFPGTYNTSRIVPSD
jgi:hypothetical protein